MEPGAFMVEKTRSEKAPGTPTESKPSNRTLFTHSASQGVG